TAIVHRVYASPGSGGRSEDPSPSPPPPAALDSSTPTPKRTPPSGIPSPAAPIPVPLLPARGAASRPVSRHAASGTGNGSRNGAGERGRGTALRVCDVRQ